MKPHNMRRQIERLCLTPEARAKAAAFEPKPRIAREGFVPAGPKRRPNENQMLIPKAGPGVVRRSSYFEDCRKIDPIRQVMGGELSAHERQALRDIVELGSFEMVEGRTWLVAPVTAVTQAALAAFEADREDIEDDNEDLEHDGSEVEHDDFDQCDEMGTV